MQENKNVPDVVFLTPSLGGGLGLVTRRLAEGIGKKGFIVEIWCLDDSTPKDIWTTVPVTFIEAHSATKAFPQLVRLWKQKQPKSILSASYHISCVALLVRLLFKLQTRLVVVEHTSLTNGLQTISTLKRVIAKIAIGTLYRFADAWVAVSNDVGAQMASYGYLQRQHVFTIYNPVITEEIFSKSEEIIQHSFFSVPEPIILAIGRLSPEKDYISLIKAMEIVNKKFNAYLIIAGEGSERSRIEKQITVSCLEEKISLLGHVANPYPLYKKADLFVLSSYREGLPTVLIEALAFNIPIVSTDARSGPREILRDGELGVLVPIKNPAALAEAIIGTLSIKQSTTLPHALLEQYKAEYAIRAYLKVLFPKT